MGEDEIGVVSGARLGPSRIDGELIQLLTKNYRENTY
jgi:hypothetical protein